MALCRRLMLALMAAALAAPPLVAAPRSGAPLEAGDATAADRQGGAVALTLRRGNDSVDLVVEGTGAGPVLQQSRAGQAWQGQLRITSPGSLRMGPQRMSLPEAGLQSVSLQGSGSDYQIEVVPMPGAPLSRPVVSADGRNLIISFAAPPQSSSQTNRFNLREPGMVPQATYAPPLQPRAVAPPLGDMAVGTMLLRNRSYLNVSGPPVTMTLRNAPAKDALMALAQMAGYGFVYVDENSTPVANAASGSPVANSAGAEAQARSVSISFRGESYSRALNAVLLAAGLQGRLEGNMIFAGPSVLAKTFGSQVSKVYRLNQASAASAADYLASLGAQITKVTLITNLVTQGQSQANQVAGGPDSQQTQTQRITTTETYGASLGPLKGLTGTTDSRLQTITLVGDPQVVSVAENYLRQIDLRQRQVALSVKILDVTLDNDTEIDNSFAFRNGSNFVVNDSGTLLGSFGGFMPPIARDLELRGIPENISIEGDTFTAPPGVEVRGRAGQVRSDGSLPGPTIGGLKTGVRPNPGLQYPQNQFYDFLRSKITSTSTKVLASPTLIISENPEPIRGGQETSAAGDSAFSNAAIGRPFANESFITVGTQVITDYAVQAGQNGAANTCQPSFGTSGLTFGARVSKIDDNGYVTFSLSPAVSASTRQQNIQGCGLVDILSIRRLDTGTVRVRDGQTLILTGVIQDADAQVVSKWPVLGDLPLIGQFFRFSAGSRSKNELVIMVTPRIVDDSRQGLYGYGYRPELEAARGIVGGSL